MLRSACIPGFQEILGKKTHPIAPVKYPCKSPWLVLKRLDIHNLDEKQITRGGALNLEGPGEVVDLCEIHVFDVVGRVIVLNLAAGPGKVSDCLPDLPLKVMFTSPDTQS
jgi:hypothetical protein